MRVRRFIIGLATVQYHCTTLHVMQDSALMKGLACMCALKQDLITGYPLSLPQVGKPSHTVSTKGENINICWSSNGQTIAVGNKVHITCVLLP